MCAYFEKRREEKDEYQRKNAKRKKERKSSYLSCFIFGRFRVQISARRPDILTNAFWGFPSPSRQILGQQLKVGHGCLFLYLF
jgi:hypothetical protein